MSDAKNSAIVKREVEVTSSLKRCSLQHTYEDAEAIKAELLKTQLDGRFHNASLMSVLFCMFDMILYAPMSDRFDQGDNEASSNIDAIFTKMKRIGADSAYGLALLSSFKDVEDMFVIKVPRPNQAGEVDDLYHEFFVGISCANDLREFVPNFAYIFGAFKCLPPRLQNKDVIEFCSKGDKERYVNYVIYEKIEGKDLFTETKTCSFVEFFGWFIQIVLALHIASEDFGFTHYDLHTGNVIERVWRGNDGLGNPLQYFWIPYHLADGTQWWVKTNRISTFIDYGMSHVETLDENGEIEHYGHHGLEQYGVYANRARPWFDLYKVLGNALHDMLGAKNFACLDKALPLYQLIEDQTFTLSKEELYEELRQERKNYFVLSEDVKIFEDGPEKLSLLYYLDLVKRQYPNEWKGIVTDEMPSGIILDCQKFCPSAMEVEDDLTATPNLGAAMRMIGSNRVDEYEEERILESLPETVELYRADLHQMATKINTQLQNLTNLSNSNINKTMGHDDVKFLLDNYVHPHLDLKEQIAQYMSKVDVLRDYESQYGSGANLVEFELSPEFNEWRSKYQDVKNRVNNAYFDHEYKHMKHEIMNIMNN
jgi:hypothetical protein